MTAGEFQELRQRPVRLKPVGRAFDGAPQTVFHSIAIVSQSGDGGQVVPGILPILRGFRRAYTGIAGLLSGSDTGGENGTAARQMRHRARVIQVAVAGRAPTAGETIPLCRARDVAGGYLP